MPIASLLSSSFLQFIVVQSSCFGQGQGRGDKEEWEKGERTWPLSSLLGSCGSLVSLALSHESIPVEYPHGYIYILLGQVI